MMELELNNSLFEWFLADWAGHGNDPADIFPSMRGVNLNRLANEFVLALRDAGAPVEMIDKFRREAQLHAGTILA
jgi:hypothetical protein